MSFWSRIGVTINDLECFRQSCKKNGVTMELNQDKNFTWQGSPVHAFLHDEKNMTLNTGPRQGFLLREGGAFKLAMDTDLSYSPMHKRLGKNGGILCRDYTQSVVEKEVKAAGGMINSAVEQADGSVVLRIAAL